MKLEFNRDIPTRTSNKIIYHSSKTLSKIILLKFKPR